MFLEYVVCNKFFYSIYSGLYLNQVPINTDTRDETKILNPTNDVNPSSFAINDNNPIDDMGGHLSRSLLWESNYSSSTGGKIYSRNTRKCDGCGLRYCASICSY